jgi:hypothetical protein
VKNLSGLHIVCACPISADLQGGSSSSNNTVFSTTQCPDSKRETLLYIYEEFSSLKPILLMNSSSLQQQKKVFVCCLESSRYICVKFYTRFLWHPQFPFSFHHSQFWNLFFSWQICDGLNTCACQKVHTYDYAQTEIFLNHRYIYIYISPTFKLHE